LKVNPDAIGVHSRRNPNRSTTAYLTFLADHGYTLSDVEQLARGTSPQPDSGDGAPTGSGSGGVGPTASRPVLLLLRR
jgi:hypothetical protein